MQLYCGTTTQFVDDTLQNRITGRLEETPLHPFPLPPFSRRGELLAELPAGHCNVVQYARLDDNGLVLEYQLP